MKRQRVGEEIKMDGTAGGGRESRVECVWRKVRIYGG